MIFFRKLALNLILFLNVLLIFLTVFEEQVQVPVFLQVTGRLHPAVVHFPLVLLFVVIFLEWLSFKKENLRDIIEYLLFFFALSAAFGALFGFFLLKEGGYQGDEVNIHRWSGTVLSVLSALILLLNAKSKKVYYYILMGIATICLVITGHVGSEVTHGKGFVTEPIRRQQKRIEIEHPDSAIVFRDVIQPIFNEKCVSCHNASKAKNDLILTDYKNIMSGGESPGSVVAGDAEKSLIYKYVLLPMSDTLHMPPEGKLQLDREEIKLIGWWINTGAAEHEQYLGMSKVDSIHSIMASKFQPKKGLDLVNIPFADPAKIKELSNPYRTVSQISAVKPYVAVFLGSKKDFTVNDLKELTGVSQQVVSIDLGNSTASDADLKALTEFPHLQKLHLQNLSITDDMLQYLRGLRYLEVLNLSGTNISGKALDEISKWKNLKKLYIYNTPVEPGAIQSLRRGNPELEVFNTQLDLTDSLYYAQLTPPVVKVDSEFFRNRALVEVKPSRGKVIYYYTLDGTIPTSRSIQYKEPFEVQETGSLKIIATMKGWVDSKVATHELLKVGKRLDVVKVEAKPDPKLSAKGDSVLVDGKPGSLDRGDKAYLAFVIDDFDALLQANSPVNVTQVTLSFLQDVDQGVLAPEYVEVWGGSEKNKLKSLGKVSVRATEGKAAQKRIITLRFPATDLRFLRVKAKNVGKLSSDHPLGKKGKATLYVDEISLN
ncbi:MAG TPA: FN3 associated domain-containing protein [Chryseolinea sp.]